MGESGNETEEVSVEDRQSDAEVIRASIQDPDAFRELFVRHYDALFSYFARRLGREAADDLAAEVFLRAFHLRARYDGSYPSARPWLYGIAANLLRRHRRTEERRLRAYARQAGERPAAQRVGWHEDTDERLDGEAAGPALAKALAALTADQREVLLLFAWADLSYEEIALALGVPVGTVRSRLSRARERVRHALAGDGPETDPRPATPETTLACERIDGRDFALVKES